ncbi:DNA polymerase IV [Pontibacillus halophilus JSM 076056 = DSM 19796]|uniref:DNA polymerase IV n=1 Tax=Pontibacillus halophilus JSM 076056 = DSM 19796 TaxID=1385510 RepID=A0A0A5GGZ7_9BACI|nr:DNA polymerase IV [Pontibacillus halophilus]KGX91304.1 DNA polymerase IV [Pontibacillus halophilus JSM 076056 = DSM 19796]
MSRWYPKNGRVILHVDMNSFYASVEMAYNPELRGKPLAIAGNPEERKGIVVTSSYEARAKGVKTTMPLWEARRLCPELIVMRPDFNKYRKASSEMFTILSEVTSLVQPVSIDEGYIDITDCGGMGSPPEIAQWIQNTIKERLDLPCSIGIAPNKFLAKMASDMKKPLGITILRKRDIEEKLWPLPVEEMYGVGQKTAEKLKGVNISTIHDLANADVWTLKRLLGVNGERLIRRANGEDQRPVDPEAVSEFKSIGNSQTLPHDTTDENEILQLVRKLSKKVADRMERKQVVSRNIQVMIRYHNRKTITRSKQLSEYISKEEDIFHYAQQLWEQHWNQEPIRLLGVTAHDFIDVTELTQQLSLFTYKETAKNEKLYEAIDELTEKYGTNPFKQLPPSTDSSPTTSFQKDFLDDYKKG